MTLSVILRNAAFVIQLILTYLACLSKQQGPSTSIGLQWFDGPCPNVPPVRNYNTEQHMGTWIFDKVSFPGSCGYFLSEINSDGIYNVTVLQKRTDDGPREETVLLRTPDAIPGIFHYIGEPGSNWTGSVFATDYKHYQMYWDCLDAGNGTHGERGTFAVRSLHLVGKLNRTYRHIMSQMRMHGVKYVLTQMRQFRDCPEIPEDDLIYPQYNY